MSEGFVNDRKAKQAARSEARRLLSGMDAEARAQASREISRTLSLWWHFRQRTVRVVMVYLPQVFSKPDSAAGDGQAPLIGDEPDLSLFIEELRFGGAVLAAPRMDWDAKTMQAVELSFGRDRKPISQVRRHNIAEPVIGPTHGYAEPRIFQPQDVDAVMVPGVAFDLSGGRVGRGAGFYDRWLASAGMGRDRSGTDCGYQRMAIGVAFDVQVLREVPRDSHDVPMDAVVSESRWIGGSP